MNPIVAPISSTGAIFNLGPLLAKNRIPLFNCCGMLFAADYALVLQTFLSLGTK